MKRFEILENKITLNYRVKFPTVEGVYKIKDLQVIKENFIIDKSGINGRYVMFEGCLLNEKTQETYNLTSSKRNKQELCELYPEYEIKRKVNLNMGTMYFAMIMQDDKFWYILKTEFIIYKNGNFQDKDYTFNYKIKKSLMNDTNYVFSVLQDNCHSRCDLDLKDLVLHI